MFGGVGVDRGEDDKKEDMTELLNNIFAIEVPPDAKDFGCVHIFHGEDVLYYPGADGETVPVANAPCHCDQVEIMFTTKGVTEAQARPLVKSHYSRWATINHNLGHYQSSGSRTTFMDYENGFCTMKTATESLQSLLKSKGLTAGNYLIIKKVER